MLTGNGIEFLRDVSLGVSTRSENTTEVVVPLVYALLLISG